MIPFCNRRNTIPCKHCSFTALSFDARVTHSQQYVAMNSRYFQVSHFYCTAWITILNTCTCRRSLPLLKTQLFSRTNKENFSLDLEAQLLHSNHMHIKRISTLDMYQCASASYYQDYVYNHALTWGVGHVKSVDALTSPDMSSPTVTTWMHLVKSKNMR